MSGCVDALGPCLCSPLLTVPVTVDRGVEGVGVPTGGRVHQNVRSAKSAGNRFARTGRFVTNSSTLPDRSSHGRGHRYDARYSSSSVPSDVPRIEQQPPQNMKPPACWNTSGGWHQTMEVVLHQLPSVATHTITCEAESRYAELVALGISLPLLSISSASTSTESSGSRAIQSLQFGSTRTGPRWPVTSPAPTASTAFANDPLRSRRPVRGEHGAGLWPAVVSQGSST